MTTKRGKTKTSKVVRADVNVRNEPWGIESLVSEFEENHMVL